ncbi:MAG: cytochrome c [Chitinivorax sp.]
MPRLFISLILLPLLLLAGCGPDKDSPVYQRKQAFKQMMRHKEAMYGMLSGRIEYEPKRFAAELAQLQQASQKPWPLFTELKDSRAKQEVLLDPAAFKQAQDRYQQALSDLAAVQPLPEKPAAVRAPFKALTDSCQACHDRFRIE